MGFIKNINNVYIPKCGCATWYEHWTNSTDQWLICCAELTCTKPISQGALVQDAEKDEDKWYVVPLCRNHANSNDILDIGDAHLVPVETASALPPTKDKKD
jgi:hypothetical protein